MTKPTPKDCFWMVARRPSGPQSRTQPTARYATKADAIATAERLATSENAAFVVLEVTEVIYPGTGMPGSLI